MLGPGGRCWGGIEEEERLGLLDEAEAMRGVTPITANLFVSRKAMVFHESDDETEVCMCTRADCAADNPGCADVDCLNYATCVECTPGCCPCGDELCGNQRLQRRSFARFRVFKTMGKGFGLKALQTIHADGFVVEFVGEVIDAATFAARSGRMGPFEHMFFQRLRPGEYLDAKFKGATSRFINHSCSPNCRMEIWQVGAERRIGIFASEEVEQGEELTIDYGWEWGGHALHRCLCDAPDCRGYLETNVSEETAVDGGDDGDGGGDGGDGGGGGASSAWRVARAGELGAALVGRTVRVLWPSDGRSF